MALFETKRAWFFDDRGEYHGKKGFSKHSKTIKYSEGAYNINFQESSYKEDNPIPLLWKRRTYFYNLLNSNPIKLDKKAEPPISPELYNINLETKVARDLNDLAKGNWLKNINPKQIIIILAIVLIGYWLISSGKLSGLTGGA